MAGGPSTPALVNAVSFGFIALGTCTVAQARGWLAACEPPFGANLFVPQREPKLDDVLTVARRLHQEVPEVSSDYAEKFALVLDAAPAVVSSTFGCFTDNEIAQLHAAGSEAWATVTNPAEIAEAQRRGVDGVIVQGPRAGGHRATWDQHDNPDQRTLEELLALASGPVIAAGGVRGPEDVEKLAGPRERLAVTPQPPSQCVDHRGKRGGPVEADGAIAGAAREKKAEGAEHARHQKQPSPGHVGSLYVNFRKHGSQGYRPADHASSVATSRRR